MIEKLRVQLNTIYLHVNRLIYECTFIKLVLWPLYFHRQVKKLISQVTKLKKGHFVIVIYS